MSVIIIFGYPGSGKTYVGEILQNKFGYRFYDGDSVMPQKMKEVIIAKGPVTDKMRRIFFNTLLKKIRLLSKKYKKLVIGQTYIKEKYRQQLIDEISEVKYILVKTNTAIRESRLKSRKEFPLDIEYARKMCLNFDEPLIKHDSVNNDDNGDENIIHQLKSLL